MGWLRVDLECPLSLTREFIARYLWFELNKRNGSAFLFETKGDSVPADKEKHMKVTSVTPQKLNAETREAEYVMTLKPDLEVEISPVEPFDW